MNKTLIVGAALTLLVSTSVPADNWTSQWEPTDDWIRIDKGVFLQLAGWREQCTQNCYPVFHTHHREEVGFFINIKTKELASVKEDNDPSIRFLSQ